MRGNDWQPLQPIDVTRDGQTMSVRFHVPFPPLAWDEAFGAPHQVMHAAWKNGRGFEVEDGQGEVTISEVTIDGDTVRLGARSAARHVAPLVVRYAMTQDATQRAGGQVGGRFGQLHDSDPLVGVDAEEIDCGVTAGAVAITPVAAGGFARRTSRDIVEAVAGSGLAPNTLVYSIGPDAVNLSQPWTGETGTARLRFRSNQWNYAVAFELPAP